MLSLIVSIVIIPGIEMENNCIIDYLTALTSYNNLIKALHSPERPRLSHSLIQDIEIVYHFINQYEPGEFRDVTQNGE